MTEIVVLPTIEYLLSFRSIVSTFSETLIAIAFLSLFLEKREKINPFLVLGAFIGIRVVICVFIDHALLRIAFCAMLDLFLSWVIFKDKLAKRVAYMMLFNMFIIGLDGAIISLSTFFLNIYPHTFLMDLGNEATFVMLTQRFVELGFIFLIKAFKQRHIHTRPWLVFLLPVLSALFMELIFLRYWAIGDDHTKGLLVAFGIFMAAQNVIVFFYVSVVHNSTNQYLEMKEIHRRQRQYWGALNAVQSTIRKMAHDIRHHFVYLFSALEDEDIPKAKDYLTQLDKGLEHLFTVNITGHPDVDALLCAKAREGGVHGIHMEVEGALPPTLDIAPVDLSALLGNALDNALQGAAAVAGEKTVNTIFTYHNGRLSFTISNPYRGNLHKKPWGYFFSQKPGGGMGSGIIRKIVKKYDGFMGVDTEGQIFTLTVLLKASQISEDYLVLDAGQA